MHAALCQAKWSALVAGPVKGEVVASWRKTSRNSFSIGVKIILRSLYFCGFVGVCLLDLMGRPIAGVLNSSSRYSRITLKGSSGGQCLKRRPFCSLFGITFHHRNSERRRSNRSLLKSDRLPTQRTVHRGTSTVERRTLSLVPLNVPIDDHLMAVRAHFVWGHRRLPSLSSFIVPQHAFWVSHRFHSACQ